jgi:putative transposase
MKKSNDFHTGRHVIFNLHVHLVFMPKYRHGVISKGVFESLREAFLSVCKDFEGELEESNYEEDHVHLLVSYPPKVALSRLVNSLKGVSARRLRALKLPEVQSKLWGKHFWSPSYCVVSCGRAPLEVIKRYIQSQQGSPTQTCSSPP